MTTVWKTKICLCYPDTHILQNLGCQDGFVCRPWILYLSLLKTIYLGVSIIYIFDIHLSLPKPFPSFSTLAREGRETAPVELPSYPQMTSFRPLPLYTTF